jgi:hypothetical protein
MAGLRALSRKPGLTPSSRRQLVEIGTIGMTARPNIACPTVNIAKDGWLLPGCDTGIATVLWGPMQTNAILAAIAVFAAAQFVR